MLFELLLLILNICNDKSDTEPSHREIQEDMIALLLSVFKRKNLY